jgi:choice-of-anchor C domain-containing protein
VKRRSGLGIAIGGVAAVALSGAALAFSGPTNASFETGTYVDNGAGFEQLNAGNTSIDGWTVEAGSVDWIGTYWPAQDGSMSIDMSGVNAGTLSQTFATTVGNTYTVSFYLSGNPAGPPTVKTLDVIATGATASSYTFDASGQTLSTMSWTLETYSFLATATSTKLSFVSTTPGAFGPALDNVVVTETVPTKDDCKKGGWRTMIDGAGNHFKNQGDCVSYFATKGKNPGALPPSAPADPNTAGNADSAASPVKHRTVRHEKATGQDGGKGHEKATGQHGAKGHDKATGQHKGEGHDKEKKSTHEPKANHGQGSHSNPKK